MTIFFILHFQLIAAEGARWVSRWSGVSRWSDRRIVANFGTMAAGKVVKKKKSL